MLLKNISDKILLLTLLFFALYSKSTAHSTYELPATFFEMDAAQRSTAIMDLSAKHFKHPANTEFIRQLAEAYTAAGQTDSAITYWRSLSSIQHANDTAVYTLAQIYYGLDSLDSASMLARNALTLQPERIEYKELLAIADYRLGHIDSAMTLCDAIISRYPSDANALLLSGIILRDEKKDDEALDRFERCLKADPANTDALIHRADEYVIKKKYNYALRDYSAARADLSNDADILNNIGICHYQSGAYQQAITFFKKAIALNSRHPQSYFNKGLSYYHLRQLDTASADMKSAGAIWDSCHSDTCHAYFMDAIYYLGMCYKKVGDLPSARAQFALLQKGKYPVDLSSEIHYIDYALYISQNWYYLLLLFLLTIGLIVAILRIMKK